MDIIISPGKLRGQIQAIPSKSQAHRLLICAALASKPTTLLCPQTNDDIEATADCLNTLGACIQRNTDGYCVTPISAVPKEAVLNCRESGSTLRFLLPIAGALGVDATFRLSGRLPKRPLSPLWEEMERMGCRLSRPTENTIRCTGKLQAGDYSVAGNVSSQFVSGLYFATSLIPGSRLDITGPLESAPYVDMTLNALALFQNQAPERIEVEGDWSNAAFFLASAALGSDVIVEGLCEDSPQGDRAVSPLLAQLENNCTIDAKNIPDLVPILAVVASAKKGATFKNISRLRLKESDRVASVIALLESLGGKATATENTLTVHAADYHSCTVDSFGDHRIAMAAAIAATVATGPVTILGAECVAKSYPSFWEEYRKLGGNYEQYIR